MKYFIQRVYWFFRKKFWYVFPVPVLIFFMKEWKEERLYLSSLSVQEKKEIAKSRTSLFLSFSVSIVLHAVFFLSIFFGVFDRVLYDRNIFISKNVIDFELMEGMVSTYLDPVYDQNSDIIVDPAVLIGKNKNKDSQLLSLSSLLKELKKSENPVLSSVFSKSQKRKSRLDQEEKNLRAGLWGLKQGNTIAKKITPMRIQLWDHMRLSNSDVVNVKVNYTHIMGVIDRHSFQFRDCYEQALLKDEKLSVKAAFFLKLDQSKVKKTKLELHGNGNPRSRRALSYCLFRESKALVFSKNKKNISVKFNLIFGL